MISFTSHDAFAEYIDEQLSCKDRIDDAFVILRCAYTQKELIEQTWRTEVMEPDWDGAYSWLNDFYEGQQFYEVAAVLLADEVADIIMDHLFFHLGG